MLSGKKKKTTKGRQKVELKRIENEDARYITFSKRRNGVFSKASEISTLCGAEVLVLIYSPAGKPHTLGSPDVNMLADRFISGGVVHPVGSPSEQAYHKARIHGLSAQMIELSRSVDDLTMKRNAILENVTTMIQGLDLDENQDGISLEKIGELNNNLIYFEEQTKNLIVNLTGEGFPPPPIDQQGDVSSYCFANPHMHSMVPYVEQTHGSIQQEVLNHDATNSTSMINPFESVQGPSVSFAPLNPIGDLASLGPSQLFQINWSDQNSSTNKNPLEPEIYQNKPSNSGSKLNNLF